MPGTIPESRRRSTTGRCHDRPVRTGSSDPAVVGDRFRRELDHPHVVAVAPQRLSEAAERRRCTGRTAAACDTAGRLHGAASFEHRGHAFARVRRKDETGSGPDIHGETQWAFFDAQESDPLVPLLRRRRDLRRLHRRTRITSGRALSARISTGRRRSFRRLRARALANVDLVSPRVEHDDQELGRRIDLRAADCRHIRLAVAKMNLSTATVGQLLVPVDDFERGVAFYRDVLGLPFLFSAPPQMAFFMCGAVRLLIGVPPPGQTAQRSATIYFRVSDIKKVHAPLTGQGVRFQADPHVVHRTPTAELWLADFTDPDDNQLALMSEVTVSGAD